MIFTAPQHFLQGSQQSKGGAWGGSSSPHFFYFPAAT
jgi:hypothetical protein